jgi:hypothetical protein
MEDAISRNRCWREHGTDRPEIVDWTRLCRGLWRGGTARQRSAHIRQYPPRWTPFGSKTDEHD